MLQLKLRYNLVMISDYTFFLNYVFDSPHNKIKNKDNRNTSETKYVYATLIIQKLITIMTPRIVSTIILPFGTRSVPANICSKYKKDQQSSTSISRRSQVSRNGKTHIHLHLNFGWYGLKDHMAQVLYSICNVNCKLSACYYIYLAPWMYNLKELVKI